MRLIYFALLVFVLGNYYQDLIKTKSGLQYMILKKGKGNKARAGDEILLFETTRYRDGTVLYTNENSKNPVKVKDWSKSSY